MAKRTTTSKTRTTLIATAVLLVCVSLPWACEFDTTPVIHKHPPVKREQEPVTRDDNDSGGKK